MAVDVVVVGGGIIGLAAARGLLEARPSLRIRVLEKEARPALHQTGRNSGVVHSGLYYAPGSLKARFAKEGGQRLDALCRERGIPFDRCGKVLLAVSPSDEVRLAALESRAEENGVPTERLTSTGLREREPEASPGEALLVPSTAITDFSAVAAVLAETIEAGGGTIETGARFEGVESRGAGLRVSTSRGTLEAGFVLNCGGLESDRVARRCGVDPEVRIVPFRGEYFRLRADRRHLVRHLIYPVPDPELPFLGVHAHRGTDGEVHAGPNAVLAARREGYRRRDVSLRDLAETLAYPGFWRLIANYGWRGSGELVRSLSKRVFTSSLQRLVPAIERSDLLPARAGVRAQALHRDGRLADDFLVASGERSLHVVNAPSPAATSCLPIGDHVARLVLDQI